MTPHGNVTPLAVITTGDNVPDISAAGYPLDAPPPVGECRVAPPRRRLPVRSAEKGYDSAGFRDACRKRRTEPDRPATRNTGTSRAWANCATSWNKAPHHDTGSGV